MNAQDRNLIFGNFLNNVHIKDICTAFKATEQEVLAAYNLVIDRIKLCRFKSQMPYMKLDTLDDAKQNRLELLKMADELEPYFDVAPKVKIVNQPYMGM